MLILLGIFLVVVSLLLFSYYHTKANNDDLNRPTFFNSKSRKYFLLVCMTLFFVCGESLLIMEGSYNWTWFVPLVYFASAYFVRSAKNENLVVTKIFKYYKIFSDPELALPHKDRFYNPIGFLLTEAKMPPDFIKKAKKYIEKRVAEGKIKDARDLPQETWTIIGCIGKDEINGKSVNKISVSKINYYYEEIFQDKKHNNFTEKFIHSLWQLEAQFERLFKNYAFVCLARPDFAQEEVQLVNARVFEKGKEVFDQVKQYADFTKVSSEMAKKFGWVVNLNEYLVLAALEFQRRFPEHKFSRGIKKQHKYTNEQISEYAEGGAKLDISKIKLLKP